MNFSKPLSKNILSGAGLSTFLIYLYSFSLPLRFNLKAFVFIALLVVFLYQQFTSQNERRVVKQIFKNSLFWLLSSYVFLGLVSLLWTSDVLNGLEIVILQVTLPLLPLVFYRKLTHRQVHNALHLFLVSCFMLCLYSLALISISYLEKFPGHSQIFTIPGLWKVVDWTYISYFLPQNVGFHAPFFSLYIGVCLIISSFYLYKSLPKRRIKRFFLYLFLCFFFLGFQALLASRTALAATVLVISLAGVYTAFKTRQYGLIAGVFLLTLGLGMVLYEHVSYLKIKLSSKAGVSERATIWNEAADLIQENPLTGVGVGDRQDALIAAYKAINFKQGVDLELNAHNQFLDAGVALGIPGMALFSAIFFVSLVYAIKQKDYIFFCAALTIGLCCVTESIFQRRDGVLLFSFLVALLHFARQPEETPRLEEPR